jgi:DNA-binding response OmpR family regulator
MKILLAEDDPIGRSLLATVLSGWGYQVTLASNGNEAWLALQSEGAPRLALLDWMMPGLKGSEICRKLRRLEAQEPRTYIILLTAHEWQDMETGADDYLFKPFRHSELRARLHAGMRTIRLQKIRAAC